MLKVILGLAMAGLCFLAACDTRPKQPAEIKVEKSAVAFYPNAAYIEVYTDPEPTLDKNYKYKIPANPPVPPVRLTAEQRVQFEAAFQKVTVIQGDPVRELAECYEPHHFFVYRDATGKKIGEINICLCCHNAGALPIKQSEKTWVEEDWNALRALVESLGLSTQDLCH